MGRLTVIGLFGLFVFCMILGLVANRMNSDLVQVNMYFWTTPEVSLGSMLVITLFLGCVSGVVINALYIWKVRSQRNKLKKQLIEANSRFEKLQ